MRRKKLTPEVQKAMVDVAEEIIPSAQTAGADGGQRDQEVKEAAGVRFKNLQGEVNAKFKELMKGVAKNWSEGFDGRGKRGSDALKEFDAAVAAIPAK